jgi:hypothetical protein
VKSEIRTTDQLQLDLLFTLNDDQDAPMRNQEVRIRRAKNSQPAVHSNNISEVSQEPGFRIAQKQMQELGSSKKQAIIKGLFSRTSFSSSSSLASKTRGSKQIRFESSTTAISTLYPSQSVLVIPPANEPIQAPSTKLISNLCDSLNTCTESDLGFLTDESDRTFQLSKPDVPRSDDHMPMAQLVALPAIIDAHYQHDMRLTRLQRLQMASNLPKALLQLQKSPWVQDRWDRSHFQFLTDMDALYNEQPYLSRSFMKPVGSSDPIAGAKSSSPSESAFAEEEDTRAALFTIGITILELIFGQPITACPFRKNYYGPDGKPNDLTDANTAEKWSKTVLGEYGPEISEVIRRCLHCSFGPAPNMSNPRFREALYQGVVCPLADALKPWEGEVR